MKKAANDRTCDENLSSAYTIDDWKHDSCCDKENNVLDDGGCESNIASLDHVSILLGHSYENALTRPAILKM
jgi:hypothetical protein